MTEIKPIRSEADYEAALAEADRLWGARSGTAEGDRLDVLATLIDAYETEHHPIDLPDPIEAIKFRMEQRGLSRKDLEGILGTRTRIAEVLNRRRSLSINMIRRLHEKLGISAEVLIRASRWETQGAKIPNIETARSVLTTLESRGAETHSYLFGWNPSVWPWEQIDQDRMKLAGGERVRLCWQCSNRQAKAGDLAYVVRYGAGISPKGIVAKGTITRDPYLAPRPYLVSHPISTEELTYHVDIDFQEIRFSSPKDIIPLNLLDREWPEQRWNPQNSGILIKAPAADGLGLLWRQRLHDLVTIP